jgi:hypothetical protein
MQPIEINTGTLPSVDKQINNSKLLGAFLNEKSEIQLLPNSTQTQALADTRVIFQSSFNDRLILSTNDDIYYIENGLLVEVGTIIHSSFAVRMAENQQGQVCIVNGVGAWIFNQSANTLLKLDSDNNGFDIDNPTDVTSLDTSLIVTGGTDKRWIVSAANDAITWAANEVVETDVRVGNLIGVESLDNNLYIFGEGGVQRWIPSIERVPNSFPFSQDPTYQDSYGLNSTASLVSQNNELFYLSNDGEIRHMTPQGKRTISNDGIQSIINGYKDTDKAYGSYYYYKGNHLYQLTFETDKNCFIYCSEAGKFSESDDLIIGFDTNPIKSDGVYKFNTDYSESFKNVVIQTPYIIPKNNDLTQRAVLGAVIFEATQGKETPVENQSCFLSISKDNIVYGNDVRRTFSKVGERLFQFRWYMNYVNTGFSFRFTFKVKNDITLLRAWFNLT